MPIPPFRLKSFQKKSRWRKEKEAGESYLPEGMPEPRWYRPVPRGLEQKIADKLAHLRERDAQAGKDGVQDD